MRYTLSVIGLLLLMSACDQSEYSTMVKSELEKGVRKDSILLGIYMGDTRTEFFGKCFDLNKKRLVRQGPGGPSVEYIFIDSLVHEKKTQIQLLFFPGFDSLNKITDMHMEWSYSAWAPWNRSLQSDSLKQKVIDLLEIWYGGNHFVTANVNERELAAKVDGNRRIIVYLIDHRRVAVDVQDILHPKFKHSITE